MIERRPPRWNIVSVCTPFVGFLCGFGFVLAANPRSGQAGHVLHVLLLSWVMFCVFGLIAAGVALFRKERLWGLTALAIVLNSLAFLLFLNMVCMEFLDFAFIPWLR